MLNLLMSLAGKGVSIDYYSESEKYSIPNTSKSEFKSSKSESYLQGVYHPNFILLSEKRILENVPDYLIESAEVLLDGIQTGIRNTENVLTDFWSQRVYIICFYNLILELINNIVYFSYLQLQITTNFFQSLPSYFNLFKEECFDLLNILGVNSQREFWWLSVKIEIRSRLKQILQIYDLIFTIIKKLYLVIIITGAILTLGLGSSLKSQNLDPSFVNQPEKSVISKVFDNHTIQESIVYSDLDTSGFTAISLVSQESEKKDLAILDRIVTHKVQPGETAEMIAEIYGLRVDTVLFNNNLKAEDQLPEEIYLPWTDGYIYEAKADTKAEDLEKIYNVDKNLIYAENEDIFNQEAGNFPHGSYILIPSTNYQEIAKYNQAEEERKINLEKAAQQKAAVKNQNSKKASTANTYAGISSSDAKSQGFIWPTNGKITRCVVGNHVACDIANSSAPPIFSVQSGTVAAVYQYSVSGYGLAVLINHDNGLQTLYAHLSEIYVSPGQAVTQGQSIGRMGSTGFSTGIHLHFEVRKNGVKQNPLVFLP